MKFGKATELRIIARMLDEGLDVYLPVSDDHGVDCVVRAKNGVHFEIQIKAFSKNVKPDETATFANIVHDGIHKNYFFVFFSGALDTMWILSSKEFLAHCTTNKAGKNKGKRNIRLSSVKNGTPIVRRETARFVCKDFSRFR